MYTLDKKDFRQRQMEIREDFDPYLSLPEVRRILSISYENVVNLIRDGELPAIKAFGSPPKLDEITSSTTGLRILPEDLENYIRRQRIT